MITIKKAVSLIKIDANNNKRLGDHSAFNLIGVHGIGKSEMLKSVATELGFQFHTLNVSQMSVDELTGYPIPMSEVLKGNITKFVNEKGIDSYLKSGYITTGEMKVVDAVPEWVQKLNPDIPLILVLDDDKRYSDPRMANALMEIKNKGRFNNWCLPKGSTVIANSNPNGVDDNYSIQETDKAEKDRSHQIEVKFDFNDWVYDFLTGHLDKINDQRILDFIVKNKELFEDDGDKRQRVTCRKMTKLINSLSAYDNWNDTEQLSNISILLSSENKSLSTMFVTWLKEAVYIKSLDELNVLSNDEWNDYISENIKEHHVEMVILNRYHSYIKKGDFNDTYVKTVERLFNFSRSKQAINNQKGFNSSLMDLISTSLLKQNDKFAKLSSKTKNIVWNVGNINNGGQIVHSI